MSKINKNSIIKYPFLSLLALAGFTLVAIAFMPALARAEVIHTLTPPTYNEPYQPASNFETVATVNPSPVISSITPRYINGTDPVSVTVNGNHFIPGSVVRVNNSNYPTTYVDSRHLMINFGAKELRNRTQYSITVYNPGPGGGYSNSVPFGVSGGNVNSNSNSYSNSNTQPNSANINTSEANGNEDYGGLAATAIIGADGFMPTGLVGWIVAAILITIIIILIRRIYGAEKRYHETPLKHA